MIVDLNGKKGLVIGIANKDSIAYGCAKKFREAGAGLAVTYLNEKAKPFVEPLANELAAELFMPCNVMVAEDLEKVFSQIEQKFGKLDFLLHSIAFAPKEDLHSEVYKCSKDGFMSAMDVSCYSMIEMTRLALPLMKDGGSILTMSYYGSEKVVRDYNLMGIAKAALESTVRYLAAELGPFGVRVNAISPGPIMTRAASGIKGFDQLISNTLQVAPLRDPVSIDGVGNLAAFLAADSGREITGQVVLIDGGYSIIG